MASSSPPPPPPSSTTTTPTFSSRDEQNMELLNFIWKHGLVLILALWLARVVFTAMFYVYIIAFPIVYLYMIQNCPIESSFDAKKEIKRVLRGHHLPEDHPEKPKGFWNETLARVTASVVTELSTGLGYQVTMTSLAGAAILVSVQVPAANMTCYWIGALGQWHYVWSRSLESSPSSSSTTTTTRVGRS